MSRPRSLARRLTVACALVGVALQFVRPEKNLGPGEPGPDALVTRTQAPAEIRHLLAVACNDCHSHRTRYPWYAEVQPVGWFLAQHVRDGRRALNLSDFGTLSASTQAKRLQYMADAVHERDMPLKSYLWLHPEAQLSDRQIRMFRAWADSVRTKLAPARE